MEENDESPVFKDPLPELLIRDIATDIIASDWRRVVLALNIDETTIIIFERNYAHSIVDVVYQLLISWKKNLSLSAQPRQILAKALQESRLTRVAEKYLGVFDFEQTADEPRNELGHPETTDETDGNYLPSDPCDLDGFSDIPSPIFDGDVFPHSDVNIPGLSRTVECEDRGSINSAGTVDHLATRSRSQPVHKQKQESNGNGLNRDAKANLKPSSMGRSKESAGYKDGPKETNRDQTGGTRKSDDEQREKGSDIPKLIYSKVKNTVTTGVESRNGEEKVAKSSLGFSRENQPERTEGSCTAPINIRRQKLSITLVDFTRLSSVESLLSKPFRKKVFTKMADQLRGVTDIVQEVRYSILGWTGIDGFLSTLRTTDVLLLCPSGFFPYSPTIDTILPYACEHLGRDRVGVIVGDKYKPTALYPYLRSQPKIATYAGLIIFCDCISHIVQGEHWNSIHSFLLRASKGPE